MDVHYGCSEDEVFLAVRLSERFGVAAGDVLDVLFFYPGVPRLTSPLALDGPREGTAGFRFADAVRVDLAAGTAQFRSAGEYDQWQAIAPLASVAVGDAVTLAVPLQALGCRPGEELGFVVALGRQGQLVETQPPREPLALQVPAPTPA